MDLRPGSDTSINFYSKQVVFKYDNTSVQSFFTNLFKFLSSPSFYYPWVLMPCKNLCIVIWYSWLKKLWKWKNLNFFPENKYNGIHYSWGHLECWRPKISSYTSCILIHPTDSQIFYKHTDSVKSYSWLWPYLYFSQSFPDILFLMDRCSYHASRTQLSVLATFPTSFLCTILSSQFG